jgi:hypothetical protein
MLWEFYMPIQNICHVLGPVRAVSLYDQSYGVWASV